MPNLLSLPAETLCQIVRCLDDTTALGCLSLTNQFFFNHINPILAVRLQQFSFDESHNTSRVSGLAYLFSYLKSIITCPKLSTYTKDAHVDLYLLSPYQYDDEIGSAYELESPDLSLLEKALDHLQFQGELREKWLGFLQNIEEVEECGSTVAALILLLLPNLETLDCPDAHCQRMGEAVQQTISRSPQISLCHLKSVTSSHWDTEGGFNAEGVFVFLPLPSVEFAGGHMGVLNRISMPILENNNLPPFNIKEMDFEYSAMVPQELIKIFKMCSNLKKFKYEHGGAIVSDTAANISCKQLGKALRHLKGSLEELVLHMETQEDFGQDDDSEGEEEDDTKGDGEEKDKRVEDDDDDLEEETSFQFIGSLSTLDKLTKLDIPHYQLMDPTISSRLKTLLPSSLKVLELNNMSDDIAGDEDLECVRSNLWELLEDREKFLPNLEKVKFSGANRDDFRQIVRAYKEAGIKCSF